MVVFDTGYNSDLHHTDVSGTRKSTSLKNKYSHFAIYKYKYFFYKLYFNVKIFDTIFTVYIFRNYIRDNQGTLRESIGLTELKLIISE